MSVLAEMHHVTLWRGKRELLKNVSWQIEKGDCWCVFGLNGCGKTTLLSVLTGYLSCDAGHVNVFGQSYTRKNILDLRKRIGFVSASFWDKFYCNETVLEIVLGGLSGAWGLDSSIQDTDVVRAKKLVCEFGLRNRYYSPYVELSKGERQCVLLARAFFSNPDLLVLDEPCNGLDVLGRKRLLNWVAQIARETDTTIVYVTHYLEEIIPSFTKMMLLEKGKIYASGDTEEILCRMDAFLADAGKKELGDQGW